MNYDVVIAGGSFAGLAVAAQLRGWHTLVIDHKPIGAGQTSGCGSLVRSLRAVHVEQAILQVHHNVVVHTPGRNFVYHPPEQYCTFDYNALCQALWGQTSADFVEASATTVGGHIVHTTNGDFSGTHVVDATGWRAALSEQLAPALVRRDRLNFGIETTVPYREEGLHFWYDPKALAPMRVSWLFPAGASSRVGIGSYRGESQLGSGLDRFLDRLSSSRQRVHGGFFSHALRDRWWDMSFSWAMPPVSVWV
ncbi:MAG: hypothetical protein KGJ86_05415 [Chloroflexota bacterium]|nr:hypothetical protein [Chloroflexota bacterium]